MIKRREFITGVAGAAAWPLAARAQQPAVPVIGYLALGSPESSVQLAAAFHKGLSEMGYVVGRNVAMEFRWARNDSSQLPELAADLVRRGVSVIVTEGTAAPLAAKAVTSTIPIVFEAARDPVQSGIVTSLNRPGGNVTGVSVMYAEVGGKRLELLHELLPRAQHFGVLINPSSTQADNEIADLRAAAAQMGREIEVFYAGTNAEPHPQGRETCRSARHALDQVRVRDQPASGQAARHRGPANATRHCRRGHRIGNFATQNNGPPTAAPGQNLPPTFSNAAAELASTPDTKARSC
jgi:ABC transporter substrate binding protein